jgi:putative endonuclease
VTKYCLINSEVPGTGRERLNVSTLSPSDVGISLHLPVREKKNLLSWIVYILECADKTLYTGITKNLEHRLQAHAHGKGAKYTRGRGPFSVLYTETHPTMSLALHRELAIKKLDPGSKRNLASSALTVGRRIDKSN